jgi:hypothetical protein
LLGTAELLLRFAQDVLRRVAVGVFGVAAGQAREACLALPVAGVNEAAGRAGLRGERWWHSHQHHA